MINTQVIYRFALAQVVCKLMFYVTIVNKTWRHTVILGWQDSTSVEVQDRSLLILCTVDVVVLVKRFDTFIMEH